MRITQITAPQPLRGTPDATQQLSLTVLPPQSKQPQELSVRVFIVSDVRLHRDGLSSLLQGCPYIHVLGGDTLQGAPVALRTAAADVALLDAPQPANCCLALRQVRPQLRTLVLGIPGTAGEDLSCAAALIDGYIRVDATVGEVLSAIAAIVGGESLCSPEATASLHQRDRTDRPTHTVPLTARELQVAVANQADRTLPGRATLHCKESRPKHPAEAGCPLSWASSSQAASPHGRARGRSERLTWLRTTHLLRAVA